MLMCCILVMICWCIHFYTHSFAVLNLTNICRLLWIRTWRWQWIEEQRAQVLSLLFSFNAALRSADAWFMTIIDILSLVDKIIFLSMLCLLGTIKICPSGCYRRTWFLVCATTCGWVVDLEVRFIYVHRIMAFNYIMSMRYTPLKTLFSGVELIAVIDFCYQFLLTGTWSGWSWPLPRKLDIFR